MTSRAGAPSSQSQDAVLSSVRSAIVYADAGAADWINWCRLLPRLIEHGALAVREFHPAERLRPESVGGSSAVRKAVFLLTGQLEDRVVMETLTELVTDTGLNYVIVLAGGCPELELCADVEERLSNRLSHGSTVQVRFVPLGHVTLIQGSDSEPDPEFITLAGCPSGPESLVRALHSLLSEMSLKEDIFCLGNLSCRLGDALVAYGPAKERRRLANNRRAALLLVDRALDLIGPLTYLSDSWLDSLYKSGKSLLHTDVQIDLADFTRSHCLEYLPVCSLSGCLDSPLGRRLAVESAKVKVVATAAQRAMADAMTAERVAFEPSLLIAAPSSLSSSGSDAAGPAGRLLERLAAGRPELAFSGRHAATVQLAAAVSQAAVAIAEEAKNSQQLVRFEKALMLAAAGPPEDLVSQLSALDSDAKAGDKPISPSSILVLKLIGTSLLPPPPPPPSPTAGQQPHQQETLSDAAVLTRLLEARSTQPRLRLCDCSVVPTYSPLVGQLATDLAASASSGGKSGASAGGSGVQLSHKSTGLSGLFGYLGVASKPKPTDSDLVLVCLVGGCTWAEYRVLKEKTKQHFGNKRMVLVTDRLLRGRDQLIDSLRRGELF